MGGYGVKVTAKGIFMLFEMAGDAGRAWMVALQKTGDAEG